MTEQKLEQLVALRQEIDNLKRKIEILSEKPGRMTSDKVQASMEEYPYISTYVNIRGRDRQQDERITRAINREKKLLKSRLAKAEQLENEIKSWIEQIEDSKIRQIVEYKYIDNLTWQQIGEKLHMDRTTAKKKLVRYLEKK